MLSFRAGGLGHKLVSDLEASALPELAACVASGATGWIVQHTCLVYTMGSCMHSAESTKSFL